MDLTKTHRWRVLAPVDLTRADAVAVIGEASAFARRVLADVTLLSVVDRRKFDRGEVPQWPNGLPDEVVRRVVVPGEAEQTISRYADQVRADVILLPADAQICHGLRRTPLAAAVAAVTSRCVMTVRTAEESAGEAPPLRIGCVLRLDEADDRVCQAALGLHGRCDSELFVIYGPPDPSGWFRRRTSVSPERDLTSQALYKAARSLRVPWRPLLAASTGPGPLRVLIEQHALDVVVAGRAMYVSAREGSRDLLPHSGDLPCSVFSVPHLFGRSLAVAAAEQTAEAASSIDLANMAASAVAAPAPAKELS